ncbi:TetR/AcrR family transcriptional regulator [Aeromicrobium stalagmiti]|uniref:TetR/AcrR family transcriptional regulator n=1 Tax=Aeromicrobium stalagmiti TaxID=2738988 RepID=UPI001569A236|nr:TetR/AcrR family transcriptional regulator [Aeromicrobium stalagmiti]NRQ49504.1 TetR/AcrR family transcriptional regulator [Aeromicrobium stalagmiti]
MVTGKRMKAEDRKVLILEAAIEEYGRAGMQATSTEAIAERAGVSQPYLFRLFGTKAELIAAAIEHHTTQLRATFRAAAEQRGPDTSALEAMGVAYIGFLQDDANSLRCQLHTWAAASDPAIKDVAQRTYREIWDDIAELSGASADEVRDFMAQGMLLTILGALDLTELYGDPLAVAKEF